MVVVCAPATISTKPRMVVLGTSTSGTFLSLKVESLHLFSKGYADSSLEMSLRITLIISSHCFTMRSGVPLSCVGYFLSSTQFAITLATICFSTVGTELLNGFINVTCFAFRHKRS